MQSTLATRINEGTETDPEIGDEGSSSSGNNWIKMLYKAWASLPVATLEIIKALFGKLVEFVCEKYRMLMSADPLSKMIIKEYAELAQEVERASEISRRMFRSELERYTSTIHVLHENADAMQEKLNSILQEKEKVEQEKKKLEQEKYEAIDRVNRERYSIQQIMRKNNFDEQAKMEERYNEEKAKLIERHNEEKAKMKESHDEEVDGLEKKVDKSKEKVAKLEENVDKLEEKVETLKEQKRELQEKLHISKQETADIKANQIRIQRELEQIKNCKG